MTTVFLVSSSFFVFFLSLYFFEIKRKKRIFEFVRLKLDVFFDKLYFNLKEKTVKIFLYLHKDVFLNFLHMATYLVLFFVKKIENKLEKIILFLRSFKSCEKKEHKIKNTFEDEKK